MRRLLVLGKGGLEAQLPLETWRGAGGERHVCGLLRRLHWETPGAGSVEGWCWGRPTLLLRRAAMWLQMLRWGSLRHPRSGTWGSSSAGEREGLSPPPQLHSQGCPTPAPGITHLCPKTVVAETRGQRSVTLFSSAAAICWRRKASCIFWAAGSSSRALMTWS